MQQNIFALIGKKVYRRIRKFVRLILVTKYSKTFYDLKTESLEMCYDWLAFVEVTLNY